MRLASAQSCCRVSLDQWYVQYASHCSEGSSVFTTTTFPMELNFINVPAGNVGVLADSMAVKASQQNVLPRKHSKYATTTVVSHKQTKPVSVGSHQSDSPHFPREDSICWRMTKSASFCQAFLGEPPSAVLSPGCSRQQSCHLQTPQG